MKGGVHLIVALVASFGCLFANVICAQSSHDLQAVSLGVWGGEHIQLTVYENGATLEYDCAFGNILEPLLYDENGQFEVKGVYSFETGGPTKPGYPQPKQHEAFYRGWVKGDQMSLTTTLPVSDRHIGDFILHFGADAALEKCM